MREAGPGTYLAGNAFPNSTVGMGMGGGNPAAGNAGRISLGAASEDAFDNAANGRPSAMRPVRSNRVTAARRRSVRPLTPQATPQPSRDAEARVNRRGAESAWSGQCAASASQQGAGRVERLEVGRDRVIPETVHARVVTVVFGRSDPL